MQMKLEKRAPKFNKAKVQNLLIQEDEFITNLLAAMDVPDSVQDDAIDEMFLTNPKQKIKNVPSAKATITERAQNADQLQQRLEIMKNKMQSKKAKPSQRTIKKREQKKLKKDKEFKKRIISVTKSTKNEQLKEEKFFEDNKDTVKPAAMYNEDGKIVFSKFEFAARPGKGKKNKKDKVEKNPKLILQKIKKQKREINNLIEQGETDKATEIKKDLAWKKAFDKTEGRKVKDDTALLSKTIKRRKVEKVKSKENWKKRTEKVESDKAGRQKKRNENIKKKQDEKKKNKLKKLSKRGRIIPGYSG